MTKKTKEKTPEQIKSNEDWVKVYEYMKEILGYDEKMALPKYAILRLKGLHKGKFMANKKQKAFAEYSFHVILVTMKVNRFNINSYLHNNQSKFKDEQHKINGIMVIIEKNINDTVLRLRKAEKAHEKTQEVDLSHHEHKTAQYKKKKKSRNKKLDDLW